MASIAQTMVADTPVGASHTLPRAGTVLENPFVYDSVARDIKQEALQGRVQILSEQVAHTGSESLIRDLAFKRLR